MQQLSNAVLSSRRGTIVAPAGCGKTQLIADVLSSHVQHKPALVLTHTNAGVSALRDRLKKASVPANMYRLATIDGWALKLAAMFPERSEVPTAALALTDPPRHYPQIRQAACRLLSEGHISDCVEVSYSRLLVDEYQDCSTRQHELICSAAKLLPTCVMGDPMQGIFGWSEAEPLVRWEEVTASFPLIAKLDVPWRWINAGCRPLGEWLRRVRQQLEDGYPIDIRQAPTNVKWIELTGEDTDRRKLLSAAKWTGRGSGDGVIIIGDSRNAASRHLLASNIQGAVVVEPVELRDMLTVFRTLDLQSPDALNRLLTFCAGLMTGLGVKAFLQRVDSLTKGTARKPGTKPELYAVKFNEVRTPPAAAEVLMALKADASLRVYRPTVLLASIKALLTAGAARSTLYESALEIREQFRSFGRPLPPRAVGSTLLLKGLEAGTVVILDANSLDAPNLYVALTRGAKSVVICSSVPILNPSPRA